MFLDELTRTVDEGNDFDVVYMDIARTFDKVPHQGPASYQQTSELPLSHSSKKLQYSISSLQSGKPNVTPFWMGEGSGCRDSFWCH